MSCGMLTRKGIPCKNSKNCHLHKKQEDTCAICLNSIRKTRGTRELWCGHMFHSSCLDQWKKVGKHTCPICRKKFDVSNFNVTIRIENNRTEQSNIFQLSQQAIFSILDRLGQDENFLNNAPAITDINFELDEIQDLQDLINDLELEVSNDLEEIFSNS